MAGSAELSRSLFVARGRDVIGMERDLCGAWWREGWALAEFVCGTKSWRHRDGEGLVRSMVAGGLSSRGVCLWHGVVTSSRWRGTGAEHGGGERWALAEFVCGTESWRHRYGEGLVRSMGRGGLSSRGVCLWHGVVTSSGWRGTGAEHGGGEGWALAEFVCGTESWRHRDGEGLVRSMVAGRAELSRSLFVARSRDVIGMRHWRDFCVNAQKWREKSSLFVRSTFRQMSKVREQEVFEEKMSERGSLEFGGERENVLKDQREGQATKGRLERKRQGVAVKRSSEQREERLTAKRKWAVFERSNESGEQREERLEAQHKRAAVKLSNESSKEREERLRAEREQAAAKRARETSQDKELRLRARRERAALSARTKARWGEWKLTDDPNPEGTPITADEISGRPSLQPDETDTCTTADGLTLKIAVCITKNGLKKRWQPSIASRKTCATIIVSFAKKHGRCLLPERRYTCSRCKRDKKPCRLYSAEQRHGSWKRPSRTTRPQWSRGTADCANVPDNVCLP